MGLAWRDTLEGYFCPKLVFLKIIKVRGYICNFFYLSLLNGELNDLLKTRNLKFDPSSIFYLILTKLSILFPCNMK